MGDFSIDPGETRQHARTIDTVIADSYSQAAADISHGGHISAPGFGIFLSWLEALYIQRLDFLAKDVQGASDICREIASRLKTAADEAERIEDLNVAGFGGKPVPWTGYPAAYGQTGTAKLFPAAFTVGAGVTMLEIEATLAAMTMSAALCPSFIPAVVLAALIVANPSDISEAATNLKLVANDLQTTHDVNFEKACTAVLRTWKGAGEDAFRHLTTTIKGHLDELAKYIQLLGEALDSLWNALAEAWKALAALTGPFLVWLIAVRVADLVPPLGELLEPVVQVSGAAMTARVGTILAGVMAVGSLVGGLVNDLTKDFLALMALPDRGAAGTPDLTEYKVDGNFALKPL